MKNLREVDGVCVLVVDPTGRLMAPPILNEDAAKTEVVLEQDDLGRFREISRASLRSVSLGVFGGKMEQGETFPAALLREVGEEFDDLFSNRFQISELRKKEVLNNFMAALEEMLADLQDFLSFSALRVIQFIGDGFSGNLEEAQFSISINVAILRVEEVLRQQLLEAGFQYYQEISDLRPYVRAVWTLLEKDIQREMGI